MFKYIFIFLLSISISGVYEFKGISVTSANWCEVTSLVVQAANDNFSKYIIAKNKVEGLDYLKYNLYDISYLSVQTATLLEQNERPGKFMFYQFLSKDAAEFQSIVSRIETCLLTDTLGKWNKITSTPTAATWSNSSYKCLVMLYSNNVGVHIIIQSYK